MLLLLLSRSATGDGLKTAPHKQLLPLRAGFNPPSFSFATSIPLPEPFRKLLKPGQRYSFGRKPPAELVFEDKTVSRDAGHIDVGPWEPPPLQVQVATGTGSAYLSNQATRRPYVRLHAGKKLVRVIGSTEVQAWERDKTSFIGRALQPETDHELDDGDVIVLTRSCPAATCVYVPRG